MLGDCRSSLHEPINLCGRNEHWVLISCFVVNKAVECMAVHIIFSNWNLFQLSNK